MSKLVTIRTNGGAAFTVDADAAPNFQNLLNELEASGYPIKGEQSGGYNYRNIAGTNKLSNHAHGTAVDVNWTDNPRGGMGKIPAETARALASKHGMTWGGDWKNPDPMHFEFGGGNRMALGGPVPTPDARPADAPLAMISGIGRESQPGQAVASAAAPTSMGTLDFNDPQMGASLSQFGDALGKMLSKAPPPPSVQMASASRPRVQIAPDMVAQILAKRAKPGNRGGGGRGIT